MWSTIIIPLLLLPIFITFLHKLIKSTTNNLKLPPGPRGLPVVGNLLSLEPELHSQLDRLARIHGPIMSMWLGHKLGVVISSPSLAREVLRDNDVMFANRDVPMAGLAATSGKDVVWTAYGPEWRMLRKVCVTKMLSNITLDSVYHLRRQEVRNTVAHIYSRVGTRVEVGQLVFLAILNVITNMMWGGSVKGEEERERVGSEFRDLISRVTTLLGKPNLSDFYPALARFDLQGISRETRGLAQHFDRIFDTLIEQRNNYDNKTKTTSGNDFLHYLLKLKDEDSKTPLTMLHVKALLLDMVVGGSDTSSNSIEFAMSELLNQPRLMKKAQQEVEDVVGKENIVEESHIHKFPYLQAVMKEVLRLHPVLPLMVPHSPSADSTIGGYTVPTGSRVLVNVWSIHRDPSIWDNPYKFDPDRFLSGKNTMDFTGSDFSYLPFGSGRRMCAGVGMAERMVLYTLATLLHSFNWEIAAGDTLDLSEKFGIVLKKKIPLVAVPTPRLSHPSLYVA